MNTTCRKILRLGLVVGALALHAGVATAKKPPSNPVGAGTWDTKSQRTDGAGQTYDPQQMAMIEKINAYFNGLEQLEGRFQQTDADKKVTKGRIYIKRPGRFRFEYAPPSRKIIISDGRFLAIQDLDLKNEDTYELDNTPFRILLRKDVDLLRDAKIHALSEENGQITLTLSDKDPEAAGSITIYMKTAGETLELAGWSTTDAQGLKTDVAVSDIKRPEKLDDKLFVREKLFVKSLQQN